MSELNKISTKKQNLPKVDKSRRRFSKAGAATPILMTLASQPAFGWGGGMQCMSNMMSGNLSDPNRGNCDLGWSPGGWCAPVGQIAGMDTLDAWDKALGVGSYGSFYTDVLPVVKPEACKANGQPMNDQACYVGGAVVGWIDSRPLREVVCDPHEEKNVSRHCAAAYLNARLSAAMGDAFNYVLTTQQVEKLCTGGMEIPPGYSSLNEFFDSTWEGQS